MAENTVRLANLKFFTLPLDTAHGRTHNTHPRIPGSLLAHTENRSEEEEISSGRFPPEIQFL